jgi:hypothetical protein
MDCRTRSLSPVSEAGAGKLVSRVVAADRRTTTGKSKTLVTGRFAVPVSLCGSLMRLSLIALLLANLVPLFGALVDGWSIYEIFALYWSESVVIGGYTLLRVLSGGDPSAPMQWRLRLVICAFFTFHYGLFLLVHSVFVQLFLGPGGLDHGGMPIDAPMRLLSAAASSSHGLGLLALIASHGVSFVTNFLGRERAEADVSRIIFSPYRRIVTMHLVLIAGGFVTMLTNAGAVLLALLVIAKTIADALAHRAEHRPAQMASTSQQPQTRA